MPRFAISFPHCSQLTRASPSPVCVIIWSLRLCFNISFPHCSHLTRTRASVCILRWNLMFCFTTSFPHFSQITRAAPCLMDLDSLGECLITDGKFSSISKEPIRSTSSMFLDSDATGFLISCWRRFCLSVPESKSFYWMGLLLFEPNKVQIQNHKLYFKSSEERSDTERGFLSVCLSVCSRSLC